MMDPMLPEFAADAGRMPIQPPKLPWVSTCTGRWMNPEDLADGDYWVRQVRQTVRFAEALEPVIEDPQNILLEVGPGQTLSQLARQHAKKPADADGDRDVWARLANRAATLPRCSPPSADCGLPVSVWTGKAFSAGERAKTGAPSHLSL